MMEALRALLSGNGFMPHGHCYLWNSGLIRLHVVSDALIALSYTTIPFTLAYFVRRRKDLPFSWMFLSFGLFIISCGATHVMEIWTLWTPVYWLAGLVKAVTAAASVTTAILLVRLMPRALALPSPGQMVAVEDRFRRLLEAAPDAMVIVDDAGDILLVNSQTELLFGYRREELIGRKIEMLVPERFRTGHPGHREQYSRDPKARPMGVGLDLWSLRKDGTEFPVEISLSPMRTGTGTWTTAAIRDISERKKAEEALKTYAGQLERSNRELRDFGYSVAHDLRAPARTIISFCDLIQKQEAGLGPTGRDYFGRVIAAGEKLSLMLDGLLVLSRLSQKKPSRETVDLAAAARQRVAELKSEDADRKVDLVVSAPLPADGDPGLLGILMQNLVDNAWKFTRGRQPARIEAGLQDRQGEPVYFVRDNGLGFDQSLAQNLFRPFHRLANARDVPGMGIGLASAARIVDAHGGRIWAESEAGKGATFYFTLGGER